MMGRIIWFGAAVLGLFVSLGHAPAQTVDDFSPVYLDVVMRAEQIGQQIESGAPLAPELLRHDLTTITTPTAQITVFTDFVGYNRLSYNDTFRGSPLFVTYGTQLYDFVRSGDVPQTDLQLRVNQLLGLPDGAPNGRVNDRVVEVMAGSGDILRAQRDPSITNPDSETEFPVGTPQTYVDFFNDIIVDNKYAQPPGHVPFPFTQLGYTWDWGNPESIVGLSEFVILSSQHANPYTGGAVTGITGVNAVVSLLSYRYYDRAGNFDVYGDVDTIWAGTRYIPQGSSIEIQDGATVYQGITVSSSGYTITNYGAILGPGKNFDRTFRDAVVEFEQGGVVQNFGLIAGRIGIGVRGVSTEPVVIYNAGDIFGTEYAIQTGAGDDEVAIVGGNLMGDVDGGAGANTISFELVADQQFVFDSDIVNFDTVFIESGNVQLNGGVAGNVDVAAPASLSGNATIEGNLTNDGTLNPGIGDATGSMNVGGNYRQNSGSTLEIQIAKPLGGVRESNYLSVDGTATLEAGSVIRVTQVAGGRDVIRGGDQFPILFTPTPASNIVDQGVDIETHSAFLSFTGSVITQTLGAPGNLAAYTLSVSRFASFGDIARGVNRSSMAAALDLDGNLVTGDPAAVVNELLFMESDGFNAALDQLSPAAYFAASTATRRNTQYLAQSLGNRLRDRRPCVTFCPEACAGPEEPSPCADESGGAVDSCSNGYNIFATPIGTFFGVDADGQRVGFQANAMGLMVGADRWLSDQWIGGWAFCYVHDDLTLLDGRGHGDVDQYLVGPYAGWFRDDWFANGWIAYEYDAGRIERVVDVGMLTERPRGSFPNHGASLYCEGGRDIRSGNWLITPIASLQYNYAFQDAFTEHGGAGANLRVDDASLNSLRQRLLLQVSRPYAWSRLGLVPGAFAGWAHEYLADDPLRSQFAFGTATFTTDPAGIIRDTALFGGNLQAAFGDRLTVDWGYNGELADAASVHSVHLIATLEY